jgi:cytochrome c biogenesis protein CcdA
VDPRADPPADAGQRSPFSRGDQEPVGTCERARNGAELGNTGLCCPDPVFLSIGPFIAARGELGTGAMLAAAYGLGRATPLVIIVMLARGGVDALQTVIRHRQRLDHALAWTLIAVGTFTVYGYSGISHESLFTTSMMVLPVLAYHV